MDQTTFKKVIDFAIGKEEEAATFYEDASTRADKANIKQMFKELVAIEQNHKRILEEINEKDVSEYAIRDIPNLRISDYLTEASLSLEMSYQDVLILAMKREEKAYALYADLAKDCRDKELQKVFQILAQEEAKHKLRFETEYDEYVLTED